MDPTNYNLIINFAGTDEQTSVLKKRIQSKTDGKVTEVAILNLNPNELTQPSAKTIELLKKIKYTSKIYVIDHGLPNSPNISTGHYSDLADFFATYLNRE